jgi:transcriptional regulator with XRE-family HTH domain
MLSTTLRAAREASGLSQRQLATLVRTHPTRISRIEAGAEMLGLEKTGVYAKALGVEHAVLVQGAAQALVDRESLRYRVRVQRGRAPRNVCLRIKRDRQSKGLSLLDVATALRVSRPRVVEIERGDKVLKLASAVKLARALGGSRRSFVEMALQDAVNRRCGHQFLVSLK